MAESDCPKCKGPLAAVSMEHPTVFRCDECAGIWLGIDVLNGLLREVLAASGMMKRSIGLMQTARTPTDLLCPACALSNLDRFLFRGVEVEACGLCNGVFLDPGELEAIATRLVLAERQWGHAEADWFRLIAMRKAAAEVQSNASTTSLLGLLIG